MFFADHYRKSWFNVWEPRWYNGFAITSYPPLVHQLIAISSQLVRSIYFGYVMILVLAVLLYVAAVKEFAKKIVENESAFMIAALSISMPAITVSIYVFGHLPMLFSTSMTLLAFSAFIDGVLYKRRLEIVKAGLFSACSFYSHTLTAYVLTPFFVLLATYILRCRNRIPGRSIFIYAFTAGLISIISAAGIYPFVFFALNSPVQDEIPHWSRYPYQEEFITLSLLYHGPTYALFILAIILLRKVLSFRGLQISTLLIAGFLLLLSLGLTTPFPFLLFGEKARWLTYERFSFWATPLIVLATFYPIRGSIMRASWSKLKIILMIISMLIASGYAIYYWYTLLVGNNYKPSSYISIGSDQLIEQLAEFLDNDCPSGCGYITIGLSTKAALIPVFSKSYTIDGFYPTARMLEVLKESGVESIDSAMYWPNGSQTLLEVLKSADKNGIKYVILRIDYQYVKELIDRYGYKHIKTVGGIIEVWKNDNVVGTRIANLAGDSISAEGIVWGVAPLSSLFLLLVLIVFVYRSKIINHGTIPWLLFQKILLFLCKLKKIFENTV